jgi:mono/diheme cytochrome c family protein
MRTIIASILIAGLIVVLGGFAVIHAGFYNVAATEPHWPVTSWILETARVRSIKAHATGIKAPPGLDDPAKIPMGVEHFAAHCAVCHGAPGVPKGDIANGLYPPPPDLAVTAKLYSDGELFWIIKHGIKMTGMPAWADHSDEEVWATVAFIEKLPGMTQEEYGKLIMASMAHGGDHHPGGAKDENVGASPPAAGQAAPPDRAGHRH